jgi:calcineurin-like phosphoesterase family protein
MSSNIWFTSDWHIGDHRLQLMRRPFQNHDEMFEVIRKNHNNLVKKNDTVYVLGDVCFREAQSYIPLIKTMHGKKILIKGNHDKNFDNNYLKHYFDEIYEDGSGLELDFDDLKLYLTHYPSTSRKDRFNLVGHVHDAWKFMPNMINVAVDSNNFRPVNLDTIRFYHGAIMHHFNQDIFAAYLPQNLEHVDKEKFLI